MIKPIEDHTPAWETGGMQDLIIDLVNALSAVKTLTEISCDIVDEKTLIRQALSGLLANQDMERCSFFGVDSEGMLSNVTGLSIIELSDFDHDPGAKPKKFRLGEGIIGTAASTRKMQHCENCHQDERFSQLGDPATMPGSIICVPVFTLNNVLIGVLNVSHPQPHFFTAWHTRLLEVYVNVLGQLITNRRLFQQMERQIAVRTAELERLVAETRQLKEHYAQLSMHDQLTGLHNRRYFYDQVELALAQHKRYQSPFCLLVMDIDHFKAINDTHGHKAGDKVLQAFADMCRHTLRTIDVVGRVGGEEFAILLPETDLDQAMEVAERLREAMMNAKVGISQGLPLRFTVSIGVTTLSPYNENIDELFDAADKALYSAKTAGRNRVVRSQALPCH